MVRAVLRPEHLPVDELVKVLSELKSKSGDVKPIPKAGAVLITDFGTHVAKMATLMLAVDQPLVNERLYLIRVYNGDATQMATKLEEILNLKGTEASQMPGGTGSSRRGRDRNMPVPAPPGMDEPEGGGIETAVPSKIVPDERTNSLILLGGEAAYQRVLALVRRLDVAIGPEGEGRVHVYRLEYASAEELAETLSSIISGTQQPSSTERRARRAQGQPGQPPAAPSVTGSIGADAFEGTVRVSHDTPTNSLVIIASIGDFRSLKEVIKKLDTPRPQVYIEASIVEIRLQNGLDLGTSFHGGKTVNVPGSSEDGVAIGGFLPGAGRISSVTPASLATQSGLVGGLIGPLLDGAINELLGTSIPSFGVLFQALSTSNNANVLSTPHILTTDNKEAEIAVGQNVPYRSALAGLGGLPIPGAGGQGNQQSPLSLLPTQSIQRQDLDLNLKITPHISSEDAVKLDVELTIKDLGEPNFQNLGPVWTNKNIKDTVVVADQQSVVLGGLVADRVRVEESKIPLLGDIPILGYLFKYKSKSKEKTSLLVLLTPYIVREQADLEKIVKRRVREQREFMESVSGFAHLKYRPDLDYRRKRGIIEEIHKANQIVDEEKALLKAQEAEQIDLPDGPIEYHRSAPKPLQPAVPAPGEPKEPKGEEEE
jgi:general secretion pathway protein D